MVSLLDVLRKETQVDCDTLDVEVAKKLGPFVDCTSNQAIAFFELSKLRDGSSLLHHEELIKASVELAQGRLKNLQQDASLEEFVTEIMMVKLQVSILPYVSGYIHVQTNPKFCYSTEQTIINAQRIVAIFGALAEGQEPRICIKVPATWEGMSACRILESKGIATLATTMFCMAQTGLAAHVGCTYIAPYVNELKVHFEPGYVDENKAFDFCWESQSYYQDSSHRTKVLAASLTSVDEVMSLRGLQHITISPGLLHQLSNRDASTWNGAGGPEKVAAKSEKALFSQELFRDEATWKLAFTRSGFGTSEGKIIQAINYFCNFQEDLEKLAKQYFR